MLKLYALITLMVVSGTNKNCSKPGTEKLPVCIQQKIDVIKAQPKWNPTAEVNEYRYNNQRVFLFSSECCDQFDQLLDEQCNNICAPTGGFTGKGDGRCTDFKQVATFVKLVWEDKR